MSRVTCGVSSISKGMGDQFSARGAGANMACAVYQRGWVINSQRGGVVGVKCFSISKGMGDQFSARSSDPLVSHQYIKGDG